MKWNSSIKVITNGKFYFLFESMNYLDLNNIRFSMVIIFILLIFAVKCDEFVLVIQNLLLIGLLSLCRSQTVVSLGVSKDGKNP